MGTPSGSQGKAFDEVKALLGRMDRSIDEARSKRLGPDEPEPALPAREAGASIGGGPKAPAPLPTPVSPRRAQYGRAKPLRDGAPAPRPSAWQRPATTDDQTLIG